MDPARLARRLLLSRPQLSSVSAARRCLLRRPPSLFLNLRGLSSRPPVIDERYYILTPANPDPHHHHQNHSNTPPPKPSYVLFLLRLSAVSGGLGLAFFLGSTTLVSVCDRNFPSIHTVLKTSDAPITVTLVAVNVALFALKRGVPSLTPLLVRYGYLRNDVFEQTRRVSTEASPALSILLSSFSHGSVLHLFCNCYAMYSFGSAIEFLDGWSTLLAVYALCVPFTVLGSFMLRGVAAPSLGASGACMGMVSYLAVRRPELGMGIIFIPNVSISIGDGTLLTAAYSIFSIARSVITKRPGFIDHGGHLGGLLGGYLLASEVQRIRKQQRSARPWYSR
ncbi:hypothetical protein BZA70DRAFT_285920 [Myxozyma melibiosi]|uniref:Peptidase S54 rhomboid domain-containing protein n=1 Tax=Myxozyma melibiosi TaxID=54550 RepID=A0ABR1EY02_9ASCO